MQVISDTEEKACCSGSIDKIILAIITEGFRPVSGTTVYSLEDYFVAFARADGLPILPNVTYHETPQTPERASSTTPLPLLKFKNMINQSLIAEQIIALFNSRVLPHCAKSELINFISALMTKARWFYEEKRDIDLAIEVWTTSLEPSPFQEDDTGAVRNMMNIANNLAGQNVEAAIKIWFALLALNISLKRNERIIHTMMDTANHLSKSNPVAAIKIWITTYSLDVSQEVNQRVILTIMDVANKSKIFCRKVRAYLQLLPR